MPTWGTRRVSFNFGTALLGGLTFPNISTTGIGLGADISINTGGSVEGDTALISDAVAMASETIIEELGHAYNYASGSGGSKIVYDNPLFAKSYKDPLTGLSETAGKYNFLTIMRDCNK